MLSLTAGKRLYSSVNPYTARYSGSVVAVHNGRNSNYTCGMASRWCEHARDVLEGIYHGDSEISVVMKVRCFRGSIFKGRPSKGIPVLIMLLYNRKMLVYFKLEIGIQSCDEYQLIRNDWHIVKSASLHSWRLIKTTIMIILNLYDVDRSRDKWTDRTLVGEIKFWSRILLLW